MDFDRLGLTETDIAIVGMAAHLPGAGDIAAYWANLRDGIESIRILSEAELLAAGEQPSRLRRANYVPAAASLEGFDQFDAEFFGFSPKEAAILDPQHRQFLEVAWEALENAGHPPGRFPGAIGVYAGCGMGTYLYFNLCSHRDLVDQTGMFLLRHTGNDKDFLATRVSHLLDLKGPSVNVQTACSTSLVAVHLAAQAILQGECDLALAGGVTVELPQGRGYLHQEGEILSPDGHCHAFDHRAAGTVFGSGAGCVVLRRAREAFRDGDHIWAILKGTAINNDGAAKAGYLAPSVEGQAACIAEAQMIAEVRSETVTYVECHGTGTALGDPIEVAALTQAFASEGERAQPCRIGSVKTNIGHLDTAAGVASLIKVALSLHHRQIPPSLGYEAPNPAIDFAGSPFVVNDRLTEWKAPILRAGVNSLGVGGTNAHAVLEEAPPRAAGEESLWPFQPLVLSAKSKAALDGQAQNLAAHLRAHPEQALADIAWTLKEGRTAFEKRRVVVASSHVEAAALLEGGDPRRVFNHEDLGAGAGIVFMFPGGGAQYAGMARDLYETEPVFADWMDGGLAHLAREIDYDPRALWLPTKGAEATAEATLRQPSRQLPLLMITEFALAKLFESWGIRPSRLIGHSMGENTAAALAGVMSFEDCISLVHLRGRLFDRIAGGGMLSVPLSPEDLRPFLGEALDIAAINAPKLTVVSGPEEVLEALETKLAVREIEARRIAINIAAHSHLLEPILDEFRAFLQGIDLKSPSIPIISNRSGQPLTEAEARDPDYWVAHLRGTVDFQSGLAHLKAQGPAVFIEMGPGRALSSLAQANGIAAGQVVPALRHPDHEVGDDLWHVTTIARLWACGCAVDWAPIWDGAKRRRVPLPSYAFQRKRYFIAPAAAESAAEPEMLRSENLDEWLWLPQWRPEAAGFDCADLGDATQQNWLVFEDGCGVTKAAVARLRTLGHRVVTVAAGDIFTRRAGDHYLLAPEQGRESYELLIADLQGQGLLPARILHGWLLTEGARFRAGSSFLHRNLEQGFWSLCHLLQALGAAGASEGVRLVALTNGAASIRGEALPWPEKAMVSGPILVAGKEFPKLQLAALDLAPDDPQTPVDVLAEFVLEEALSETSGLAAIRKGRRYSRGLVQKPLPRRDWSLPEAAHVFITGGLGGIGLSLAERLIRDHGAKVTLISRQSLPPRAEWPRHRFGQSRLSRQIAAIERLEALGGRLGPLAADVTNLEEMRLAKAAAEAEFGPVHMVIHAAGRVSDRPLLAKSQFEMEEVLAPKFLGTQVLGEVFPDGSIAELVLFSSTSTQIGAAGQVDYVAANDFLNAYAQSRSQSRAQSGHGDRTRVTALNWGMWQGVGMAAESLAPREAEAPAVVPLAADLPLWRARTEGASGNPVLLGEIDADHWLIAEHRTKAGQALLAGTGYVEYLAEAWAALGGGEAFTLNDLTFLRPLDLATAEHRALRLILRPEGAGYGFELQSLVTLNGRRGWQSHASGEILPQETMVSAFDQAAITRTLPEPERGKGLAAPQEAFLDFGPRWRVLSTRSIGRGEALATLELPEDFHADLAHGYRLHPALLDIATGWAMELIHDYRPDHLWVPMRYGRVEVHRPLPARIVSHIRNAADNRNDGPLARFDVTLATPEGEVCLEIKDFTLRKLDGGLQIPAPDPRGIDWLDKAAAPRSPAEERLADLLRHGIRPEEGAEAFFRALSLGAPQVILSPLDLPALIRQSAAPPAPAAPQAGFERPDLESAYLAAETGVQKRLVSFWKDLLGVERIGIADSFFDLGGHSLIAVRFFAMLHKEWGVDFPISVLFEAPTIAAIAALIEGAGGTSAAPASTSMAEPAAAPKRQGFTHLVAMSPPQRGARTPFFLVAGMFGNVLNLRHLAQILGQERPFYGVQARGLLGDDEPHAGFPEAARDYLVEIRQVQPHGPYLLGGFSGGGLIAWEMARQLEAAGEEVSLLTLLDTPLPQRPALTRRDRLLVKWAEIREGGPRFLLDWMKRRWDWEKAKRQPRAAEAGGGFHNRAIEAAFRAALPLFEMEERQGPTVLFRPPLDRRYAVSKGRWVSGLREYVFADNDLTRFAPNLQVIEVPGDHDSMVLEPNVRVLAARLKALLAVTDDLPAPVAHIEAAE